MYPSRITDSPRPAETWEYLIVGLAEFGDAKAETGESVAVSTLNREGANGWEAVGMTSLAGGGFAVLLKRPSSATRTARDPD